MSSAWVRRGMGCGISSWLIYGIYSGYIGIMEKKMEAIIRIYIYRYRYRYVEFSAFKVVELRLYS